MNPESAYPSHDNPQHASARVISLTDLHGEPARRATPVKAAAHSNPLHAVRAKLQVCVGEIEMSVGELLAATEHQVLVLDRDVEHPVDLLLEGKVVARGQLVAVDDRFGLRITELPLPLKAN